MKNFVKKSLNIAIGTRRPVSLIHFVTNRCNARCPHCFIDFDDPVTQSDALSLVDLEKMVKSIDNTLMNVNLTGGEPFLENKIEEICRLYLNHTSIDSMFFSTNGALTNKIIRISEKLSRDFPDTIFTFSISIDHIGERHNSYRRVKNLYENAMSSYHKLSRISENVQPNITITVCDENAEDIEEIFETLVVKEGVKSLTANIVRDEGVFKIDPAQKEKIFNSYCKLIDLIKKHKLSYSGENYLGRMMNHKEEVMYSYFKDIYLDPKYVLPCHAGGGLMGVIYPNGDVYPCETLEKKMGNLHDYNMDLMKLWDDNDPLRSWIKESQCHCTYECAWSYNILSSPKHIPGLLKASLKK